MAYGQYTEDKPKDRSCCYFWDGKKKRCMLEGCYYQRKPENVNSECYGWPYGVLSPASDGVPERSFAVNDSGMDEGVCKGEVEMDFDFYYGLQAPAFSFYRIPKLLFTNSRFYSLSAEAKTLYGILLDCITKKEILDACPDISKTTVERTLTELVKSGYFAKVGSGPATGYVRI